jgi:hypothetical protein
MNPSLIFLPSFAMVLLAYAILAFMFIGRLGGMKKHRARIQSLADPVREAQIFSESVNISDNFENLFEMPVLFFTASLVIYVLSRVDHVYLALTWLYVVLRVLHSIVHCTSNRVTYRSLLFFFSMVVLLTIWIRIASQILQS